MVVVVMLVVNVGDVSVGVGFGADVGGVGVGGDVGGVSWGGGVVVTVVVRCA